MPARKPSAEYIKKRGLLADQTKGWLRISENRKTWKLYWCSLKHHRIVLHLKEDGAADSHQGEIVVTGRAMIPAADLKPFTLQLAATTNENTFLKQRSAVQSTGKVYYLAAKDEAAMLAWMEAIFMAGTRHSDAPATALPFIPAFVRPAYPPTRLQRRLRRLGGIHG